MKTGKKQKIYVTAEQIQAFQQDRPETFTSHPIIDDILRAFATVRPINKPNAAAAMGLKPEDLNAVIKAITGMSFGDLRGNWIWGEVKRIREREPLISNDQLAHIFGFMSRAEIWKAALKAGDIETYNWRRMQNEKHLRSLEDDRNAYLEDISYTDDPERIERYMKYIKKLDERIEKAKIKLKKL